ncbi:MAG: RNA polymerase subunit sigma [Clostridia bacterium]|nr:RNA polymerase subunit sigma [Clostridia bacterium]
MNDPNKLIMAAKTDERAFEELLNEKKAWILSVASKTTGRYVTESDDEWSTALLAFSEAVKGYDEGKGTFDFFAALVIKRRLTDEMRASGKAALELSVSPEAFGEDGGERGPLENVVGVRIAKSSMETAAQDDEASRAREEIAAMQAILKEYGFSFFDLAECSPKSQKTKASCRTAVRALIASAALMAKMRLKRMLPIKELFEASGVVKKILDRHRRYIIASAEILDGEFPILASYIDYIRRG